MAKKSPSHANDPALIALGKAIRWQRGVIGISQESLALEAGIDRSYLGGIERGEHNLALINLLKISRALRLSVAELCVRANL